MGDPDEQRSHPVVTGPAIEDASRPTSSTPSRRRRVIWLPLLLVLLIVAGAAVAASLAQTQRIKPERYGAFTIRAPGSTLRIEDRNGDAERSG